MKNKLFNTGLVTVFICLIQMQSFCQLDPTTNNISTLTTAFNNPFADNLQLKNITNISCDNNTFWAVNYSGLLEQFIITGSTAIPDGIIDSIIPGQSLAVCNNLDSGSLNPTFYTSLASNSSISYYNGGTNWITLSQLSPQLPINSGGNANYLYFQQNSSLPECIVRYNGNSFSTVYTYDSLHFAVADIAVDDNGNIWCFTGDSLTSAHQDSSLYIDVISPLGQLIERYNFNFETNDAYGCFMLNNILYLGLGYANPVYPNTLLPISFSADSAFTGTPLSMLVDDWADLASCNTGSPLSIKCMTEITDSKFYPNPANDMITIETSAKDKDIKIFVYNIQGQILKQQQIKQTKTNIDISGFAKGIYFVKLTDNDNTTVTKIIKE